MAAARAARLARLGLSLGDSAAADESQRSTLSERTHPNNAALLRSVGLTSTARHGFYGALVRAAAANEAEAELAASSSGESARRLAEEAGVTADDARVLVRLLGVLPASARAADLAALEHAARRARALRMAPSRREAWLRSPRPRPRR